ncbi:7293_t:CDS:1, partial [Acaulospora colombiana]
NMDDQLRIAYGERYQNDEPGFAQSHSNPSIQAASPVARSSGQFVPPPISTTRQKIHDKHREKPI